MNKTGVGCVQKVAQRLKSLVWTSITTKQNFRKKPNKNLEYAIWKKHISLHAILLFRNYMGRRVELYISHILSKIQVYILKDITVLEDTCDLLQSERAIPTGLTCSSQPAKVLTGGGDLREAQVDIPPAVCHSCVDHIAGHCNRLPNSNGEYANANFSRVRLRAVTIKT